MKQRFWLIKRGSIYYLQDSQTGKRSSLETNEKEEAERIKAAKIEAIRQPMLNRAMAKAYLSDRDPIFMERTWNRVMEVFCSNRESVTQARNTREMRSKPFDLIRKMRLSETSAEDFLCVLGAGRTSTNHFLKRLHNLALDLKWLSEPVLEKKSWPKVKSKDKRGITWEEHQKIISTEGNSERKLFYELLWEVGAAQSDTANLTTENIDWRDRTLSYQRQKTGEWAHLMIGQRLEALLNVLPKAGPLFPTLRKLQVSDRSSEFYRRCKLLKIEGVSLHSYRYAFAERARSCGYEQQWAMAALGQNSRAVHQAYARKAKVLCPSLEEYEKRIVPLPQAAVAGSCGLR